LASTGDRFGPYRCVRKLGSGGMAETWLAVQRGEAGFEQRVCLKLIHDSLRGDDAFVRLFMREAAIGASLRHSNIVGVIDASPSEGCMALELVEGTDLRTVLAHASNQRVAPHIATFAAIELCKALHYAHNRTCDGRFAGIVHRDISPANVLVSYAGEIKLADFGIAKTIRATGDVGSGVRGKLSYMSPEQLRAQPLDARSDLFSLGVLLYEALSGQRPFDGDSDADTGRRILSGEHAPLAALAPHIPAGLTDIVEALLEVEPAHRIGTAAEAIQALVELAAGPRVYREVGALASQARPHETISEELEIAEARDGGGADDALVATRTVKRPRAASGGERTASQEPPSQPLQRWLGLARGALPSALGAGLAAALWALWSGPWSSDSSSATSLAPLETAPALRFAPDGRPGDAPVSVTYATESEASPGTLAARPAALPQRLEESAAPLGTPEGPAPTARRPARRRRSDAASPAPADAAGGTLEIGVFPTGSVWVNGALRGLAPLTVRVPAGRHLVAAGQGAPIDTRAVNVQPGSAQQLVFRLRPIGQGR
jgi:eukaryotic-like serine/threonine-protein kinase